MIRSNKTRPVVGGAGGARLVGVVLIAFLGGLGGRVVVLAAEGLVAVHARGLHGRRAAQQLGEPAQRRQRRQRAQRAALAEQLRQRDGRRQRAAGRRAAARAWSRATLQIRLLKLHTAGAGQEWCKGRPTGLFDWATALFALIRFTYCSIVADVTLTRVVSIYLSL